MSATVRAMVAEIAADAEALTELATAIASCPTALATLRRALGIELIEGVRYESRAKFRARWDISEAQLDRYIKAERIPGVRRLDGRVLIPVDAQILPAPADTALARAMELLGLGPERQPARQRPARQRLAQRRPGSAATGSAATGAPVTSAAASSAATTDGLDGTPGTNLGAIGGTGGTPGPSPAATNPKTNSAVKP